jgi:hypothetical protein
LEGLVICHTRAYFRRPHAELQLIVLGILKLAAICLVGDATAAHVGTLSLAHLALQPVDALSTIGG